MLNENWTGKKESFNDKDDYDKNFRVFYINNLNTAKQANSIL